jgi:hypothetical protein
METVTPEARVSTLERNDAIWFVGAGFLVWVAATAAVYLLGPTLLRPETPLVTAGLYLAMLPSMFLLAVGLFRYRGVVGTERVLAATLLVLPGMALDSLVVPFFGTVFPGVDPAMKGAFGGIVLVAYVEVLVTGYVLR